MKKVINNVTLVLWAHSALLPIDSFAPTLLAVGGYKWQAVGTAFLVEKGMHLVSWLASYIFADFQCTMCLP